MKKKNNYFQILSTATVTDVYPTPHFKFRITYSFDFLTVSLGVNIDLGRDLIEEICFL